MTTETIRIGFVKRSDFDPNHPDWSRNGENLLARKRITSLLEYFHAADKDSPAGKFIDEGHEPYLIDWLAYNDGMWPWVTVEDCDRVLIGENIGVYFPYGRRVLPPDTLVFWR